MEQAKIDLLKTYLSLYIDHFTVLKALNSGDATYEILDVRNAPAQAKKFKLKGHMRYLQKISQVRLINLIMTKHMSFTTGQAERLWANKPCLFC